MVNESSEEDKVSDLNVYNSSLFMFNYIKTMIKRTSQYSKAQLMVNITGVIKNGLKMYS